jgi:hypothetical protein
MYILHNFIWKLNNDIRQASDNQCVKHAMRGVTSFLAWAMLSIFLALVEIRFRALQHWVSVPLFLWVASAETYQSLYRIFKFFQIEVNFIHDKNIVNRLNYQPGSLPAKVHFAVDATGLLLAACQDHRQVLEWWYQGYAEKNCCFIWATKRI